MDARRLGYGIRTLRLKANWTQQELGSRAGVSASKVSRLERGHADSMRMADSKAIALALDAWAEYSLRWRGGDLERALNAGHAAMHESFARWIGESSGWELAPEVSFSIYGERGVIDAMGWHAATRTLLVVELKTELVDISELMGTLDRKMRLAPRVAADRGWDATTVAGWLLVADGRTNHRRLADHREVLRAAFPDDGRRIDGWLRQPLGALRAMSFLPIGHQSGRRPTLVPRKRVSRRRQT